TDYQDNAPRPARGTAGTRGESARGGEATAANEGGRGAAGGGGRQGGRGAGPAGAPPRGPQGRPGFAVRPDGKLLKTLGKPGGALAPDCCFQPNDVLVAPNGEIFVALGHGATSPSEIVKFSKDGRIVKRWGKTGTGPGEFDQPHALAMDSRGR